MASRFAIEHFRSSGVFSFDEIVAKAMSLAKELIQPSPRPVINMTGVILHTGLGRAALGPGPACNGHVAVEFDLETGGRGDRQDLVRGLLCELTGAEDAIVVNNCAAALFLTLRALCQDSEVVLSRGQMVEIGASFRIPDIVKESGCTLVEVGCTNKTRLSDFEAALSEKTTALLRCHPSNYRIVGFTEEPDARELASTAHDRGLLLIDDVGHGNLSDFSKFGLPRERTLRDSLADGADIVLASCDKLMGGPQAGVILGKTELVQKIGKHPLARAVRVDKLTLLALTAVLTTHAEGSAIELPIWRYARRPSELVKRDAQKLAKIFPWKAVVEPGLTEMGGGSMPGSGFPTWRVGLPAKSPEALLGWLRHQYTPIIGRIEKGKVWLDPRTCETEEVRYVSQILKGSPKDL